MTNIVVKKGKVYGGIKKNDPFSGLANISTTNIANPEVKNSMAKVEGMMQARDISAVQPIRTSIMTPTEKANLPKVPDSLKYLTLSDILKECAAASFESTTHSSGEEGKGHLVKEWTDANGDVHREYSDEGEYRCSVATMAEWLGPKGYKCPDPMGEHMQSYLVAKKYHLKIADYPVRCPICQGIEPQQVELAFHMSREHSMRVPAVAYKMVEVEMLEGIY